MNKYQRKDHKHIRHIQRNANISYKKAKKQYKCIKPFLVLPMIQCVLSAKHMDSKFKEIMEKRRLLFTQGLQEYIENNVFKEHQELEEKRYTIKLKLDDLSNHNI